MSRILPCVLAVLLCVPLPAGCWADEGHQVVARIAAAHLSEAALARVAEMFNAENTREAVAEAMASAAIWADQVKDDTGTESWHFLNLALQDNRAKAPERCANDDCVVARVRLFAAQLKADDPDADTRFSDEDALRFLIHLVGDVHQPLHVVSDADEGGTCVVLESPVEDAKDLHGLWDGPLVRRMGTDSAALAAELEDELGKLREDEVAELSVGNAEDWAWEAHRLAMVNVYKKLGIPKEDATFPERCSEAPEAIREFHPQIGEDELKAMQIVGREQLKKAGLRLARLLNEVLG